MAKVDKLRARFGDRIRESLGAGEGNSPTVVEHPARNQRFEGTTRATGYRNVAIKNIDADPQHRQTFDVEELRSLADSLNADGLIAPIVVRWDQPRNKYVIIAGERRYRAARLCGWAEITCDIKPDDITDGEIAEIQLAENHARKDLDPIELANAFQDVIDKNGYTIRDLAKRVGVNETTVTRYVRLLSFPDDIKKRISSGKIPIGIAREAARLSSPKEQRRFVEAALRKGYSATEASAAVSGKKVRTQKAKGRSVSRTFVTDYGDVVIKPRTKDSFTYEHVLKMLEQAVEEVQHLIQNGRRL